MQRITHNLIQSSPEWHTFRAQHFGASEANAVLGLSPYKTRDELLHEKATGLTKEVNAATQRIFDNGHIVEGLALPIVEKMTGVDFSPIVMSYGKLSASSDGLSFDSEIAWENKQFNKSHFEQVKNGELPEMHWPQCQQVLHVTGAEKLFFTISDGTEENTVGVWVYPDEEKINKLLSAWEQFEKDLANYVPPVQVEKVVAETVDALPVPSVVVRGEITASNITEITPKFDNYLANIKTELSTDQDFADAEANAKNCRETAKRIEALQENIIAQMISVNEVNSILDNYKEAFNKVGLRLEKAVKEQKEHIKTNAIMNAKAEYEKYVTTLNEGLPVLLSRELVCPNFAEAIKGVKTIESMQSRINDALAKGKVDAAAYAVNVKAKVAYVSEAIQGYEHLFKVIDLVFKDIDYIKLHIQSVKDAEDKRKAEYEAQIKAKAEADARAKVEAEQKQVNEAKPQVVEREAVTLSSQDQVDQSKSSLNLFDTQFSQVFQPSADEIVSVVAKAWNVDKGTAHKWLCETDFVMLMVA